MEARSRASTPFVLDRPSKPARLDKADTLRIDEEIAICQSKTPQPISIRREHYQPTKLTRVFVQQPDDKVCVIEKYGVILTSVMR